MRPAASRREPGDGGSDPDRPPAAREVAVRRYDETRDFDAVRRIWREVGWIEDSDGHAGALRTFFSVGDATVASLEPDGDAECAVHRTPGSFRWGVGAATVDLPMSGITAVTTSRIGRRQGLASALMVDALDGARQEGAALAVLGIFEQGYYDRFGFGSGAYEHRITVDPATLTVPVPSRAPVRVDAGDVADVHALLCRRHRGHGSVVLDPPEIVTAEFGWTDRLYGLGFRDGDGRLTHVALGATEGEHGPYTVDWLAYETTGQLLELLGAIRSLGDQVALVSFAFEPAELQLQDLVRAPIRQRTTARLAGGGQARTSVSHTALAWWQLRMLDPARCIGAVRWSGPPVSFDLHLDDPVAAFGRRWGGLHPGWTVDLGEQSSATPGASGDGRPRLDASVNALSRLWAGVRPATSLALTDALDGPADLLRVLDDVFRLPPPHPGWGF